MKQDIVASFGRKIRDLRIEAGLSQEELAARTKVHRTYIGMIERGEKNITIRNVEKLAQALNISIDQLFRF
ncbi:MAG: helix-turn-helix transcriptional regulator [Candidatus Peregrinibacteria bacterium]